MKNKKEDKHKDEKKDDKHKEAYEGIDFSEESKRLNRVVGQVEGIKKMLTEQRKLDDVLIQCKAVHSALKSVEQRLLRAHLGHALDEVVKLEKKKTRAEKLAELEDLYKHVS